MPKTQARHDDPAVGSPIIGAPPLDLKITDIDLAEDAVLWSVTTIIDALDKPAIPFWSAEQTALAAIDDEPIWKPMAERDHDEAVKWLIDARWRPGKRRLTSTDLGTIVHKLCQNYAITGEKPGRAEIRELVAERSSRSTDIETETDLIVVMLDRFDAWASRFQPSYLAAEMTVYHPDMGYAGQLDAVLQIDDPELGRPVTFLTDYKTSREPLDRKGKPRRPYPEQNALQLAGYRYARFAAFWRPRRFEEFRRRYYALSADERAMAMTLEEAVGTPIDTGLIIHITPAVCEAFPCRCDEFVFTSFLHCLECFRWLQEASADVLGDPLRESR